MFGLDPDIQVNKTLCVSILYGFIVIPGYPNQVGVWQRVYVGVWQRVYVGVWQRKTEDDRVKVSNIVDNICISLIM